MSEPGRIENDAIARRAYEIREAEGRPHGRDREHWERAALELGSPAPMPTDYRDDQKPAWAGGCRKEADGATQEAPGDAHAAARQAGTAEGADLRLRAEAQAESAWRSRAAERAIASSSRSKPSLPASSASRRLRARETRLLTVPTRVPSTSAASS